MASRRANGSAAGRCEGPYCEGSEKPKMVVFDLDYTLWQFYADCVYPPFTLLTGDPSPVLKSRHGKLSAFPESVGIMKQLKEEGYLIGIASRSPTPDVAWQAVDAFGWRKYFDHAEIFPGRKTEHFKRLRSNSGVEYKDMIFFDDEERNIRDISEIGVLSVFAPDGVSHSLVREAFADFQKRSQKK